MSLKWYQFKYLWSSHHTQWCWPSWVLDGFYPDPRFCCCASSPSEKSPGSSRTCTSDPPGTPTASAQDNTYPLLLPLGTKLREGSIFSRVCQYVHRGGGEHVTTVEQFKLVLLGPPPPPWPCSNLFTSLHTPPLTSYPSQPIGSTCTFASRFSCVILLSISGSSRHSNIARFSRVTHTLELSSSAMAAIIRKHTTTKLHTAADPGFLRRRRGANLFFGQISPKTAWKWRKLDRKVGGGGVQNSPLSQNTSTIRSVKGCINDDNVNASLWRPICAQEVTTQDPRLPAQSFVSLSKISTLIKQRTAEPSPGNHSIGEPFPLKIQTLRVISYLYALLLSLHWTTASFFEKSIGCTYPWRYVPCRWCRNPLQWAGSGFRTRRPWPGSQRIGSRLSGAGTRTPDHSNYSNKRKWKQFSTSQSRNRSSCIFGRQIESYAVI